MHRYECLEVCMQLNFSWHIKEFCFLNYPIMAHKQERLSPLYKPLLQTFELRNLCFKIA